MRRRIVINTDQATKVTLTFVGGAMPYIHFDAQHIKGFRRLTGFIEDKDAEVLAEWATRLRTLAR